MKRKLIILAGIMVIIVVGVISTIYYVNRDNYASDKDSTLRVVTSFIRHMF